MTGQAGALHRSARRTAGQDAFSLVNVGVQCRLVLTWMSQLHDDLTLFPFADMVSPDRD